MDRLRQTNNDLEIKYNDEIIKITVSIGITNFNKNIDIQDNIKQADYALYNRKRNGKNRVIFKETI